MVDFYQKEGFSLFPCHVNKLPKVASWKSAQEHIDGQTADRVMSTGGYIGAWLPENYIVIDIDMNHRDREGKEKADGMQPFIEMCHNNGVEPDVLLKETLVVKTGSGGFHLYFRLPEGSHYSEISQKSPATSVDIRTHAGYVIAAGTNGYSRITDKEPMRLPDSLWNFFKELNEKKASAYTPGRMLPVSLLIKVLSKLDVKNFNDNDSWQEFITACIATAGNSAEVLDILEEWSKSDSAYAEDPTVRRRIETFEPDGAITAGTFIYILKKEEVSKYMVDKVRMAIGAEFDFAEKFAENYPTPFNVDFSLIHEYRDWMSAFYYKRHQTSGLDLFVKLVEGNLLYSDNERCYYYYNGNYWVETNGVLQVILAVLVGAGQRFYSDVDKKNADSAETVSEYFNYLGSIATLQRFESALKTHVDVCKKDMEWDSPDNEATLTLKDCVMDFSGRDIVFRQGRRDEYRRLFIDLKEEDFNDKALPEKFREFLKDVFPNDETRKMATYVLATMLSGTGRFRKFHIWNGSGNNGKSSLMEIMTDVIGRERTATYRPESLLMTEKWSALTPEVAELRGSLVAFSSETNESKKICEGAVKRLTGDETIQANPKYQKPIYFKTTWQLVLSTNYLPKFQSHDNAFVNRLLILPFHTCFYDTEEKKESGKRHGSRYFKEAKNITIIKKEIKKERAQILYYLARRFQELDFNIDESPESAEAKDHYVKDNNDVLDLIHEVIEFDSSKKWFTPAKDIIDFYNSEENTKYTSHDIIQRVKRVFPLMEKGSKRVDSKLARGWKHIRLKIGLHPEGYQGNYTQEEKDEFFRKKEDEELEEAQF